MPTFQPPFVRSSPIAALDGPGGRLWRHFQLWAVGRSVLKAADGTYTTVDYPTEAQVAAAAVAYIGGHIYTVSTAEAAALTAAGYGGGIT